MYQSQKETGMENMTDIDTHTHTETRSKPHDGPWMMPVPFFARRLLFLARMAARNDGLKGPCTNRKGAAA